MEDAHQLPTRLRRVLTHLAAFVLYVYLLALPLSFGLGWLSAKGTVWFFVSAVASAGVLLFLGFWVFWWLAYEEDWWDDFREQTQAFTAFGLLHFVGLPLAWFTGRGAGA